MNLKKIGIYIICFLAIFTFAGCNNKDTFADDIISFKYYYGSYNSGYYDYNINVDNGKVLFVALGYNGVELNIDKEIDYSYLVELSKIINNNKINDWNNFNESNNNILDGNSFTLEIHYSNGKILKAHGYMKYPNNYEQGHKALSEFLSTIK